MGISFRTALISLSGAIVSGYGLKKCSCNLIFVGSFLMSLVAIVMFSNPLIPKSKRIWYEKSLQIYLKSLFLPISNINILKSNQINDVWVHTYIAICFAVFIQHLIFVIKNINDHILNYIVVIQSAVLLSLQLALKNEQENYWLLHMNLLFLLNHFMIPEISRKFSAVPSIDLSIISLVFLTIFSIKLIFH